jgi:PAS domain S-box-containing protein
MTPGVSISALFEAAHDAVLLADGAGTVLGVNTAAERLFGYPRDELIGRRVGELLIAEELGVSKSPSRARTTRSSRSFATSRKSASTLSSLRISTRSCGSSTHFGGG